MKGNEDAPGKSGRSRVVATQIASTIIKFTIAQWFLFRQGAQ